MAYFLVDLYTLNSTRGWVKKGEGLVTFGTLDLSLPGEKVTFLRAYFLDPEIMGDKKKHPENASFIFQNCPLVYEQILSPSFLAASDFSGSSTGGTKIELPGPTGDRTFGLKFDAKSSSSYLKFKECFETYAKTEVKVEYYQVAPPGHSELYLARRNLKYHGEWKDKKYHGEGTLFYNLEGHRPAYKGEFENGLPDGKGVFFNPEGTIRIIANNLDQGDIIGKFQLHFYDLPPKTFDIRQMPADFDPRNPEKLKSLVFKAYPKADEIRFAHLSMEDKFSFIFKELLSLRKEVETLKEGPEKKKGWLRW
jgi:hypothetical protein